MFVFLPLFIECRSQKYSVQQYFNKLENQAIIDCMKNDFTTYSLQKDSSNLNKLKEECRVREITYKRMNEGVMMLIDSPQVRDTKNNFVIINAITSNLTIPSPIISVLKIMTMDELLVIRRDAEGKITQESFKAIHSNDDFLLEKKKDIIAIENYLMEGAKNGVTKTRGNNVDLREYHVVARVNGKYIIKELFCKSN